MVAPRSIWFFRTNGSNSREKIYCRRHNKLLASCPVKEDLRLCECLSQCEMSLKAERIRSLPRSGSN